MRAKYIIRFLALICLFLLGFSLTCTGGDDDDDEDDGDDWNPSSSDDDDSAQDDDVVDDDDDSVVPAPYLSRPHIFPDFPAGPDNALMIYFSFCDEDGDLFDTASFQYFWSDDTPFSDPYLFGDIFDTEADLTNCYSPAYLSWRRYGIDLPAKEHNIYVLAWDDAENESNKLDGLTFWVTNESPNAPIISNPKIEYVADQKSEGGRITFDVCDPDNNLIGGNISLISAYEADGIRYAYPAYGEPYFVDWNDFLSGDVSDCDNPKQVEIGIYWDSLDPGEYCFDLAGTDADHQPSEYFMDLCFTAE